MNLVPLGDRVVVKSVKANERTEHGIILSRMAREKPNEVEVLAINKDNRLGLRVGDKAFVSKYSGTEVKMDNSEYIIVRERDILAVISEEV